MNCPKDKLCANKKAGCYEGRANRLNCFEELEQNPQAGSEAGSAGFVGCEAIVVQAEHDVTGACFFGAERLFKCPACDEAPIEDGFRYCPYCGKQLDFML